MNRFENCLGDAEYILNRIHEIDPLAARVLLMTLMNELDGDLNADFEEVPIISSNGNCSSFCFTSFSLRSYVFSLSFYSISKFRNVICFIVGVGLLNNDEMSRDFRNNMRDVLNDARVKGQNDFDGQVGRFMSRFVENMRALFIAREIDVDV